MVAGKFLGIAKQLGVEDVAFETPADVFFNKCSEKTPVRVSVLAKLVYKHDFPIEKVSKLTKRRADDFLEMVVAKKARDEGVAVVEPAGGAQNTPAASIAPSTPQASPATRTPAPAPVPQAGAAQNAQNTSRQNNIFNNAIAAMAAAQQAGSPNLLAQLL